MAQLPTFIPRLLNTDDVCGCLFRVPVLIIPARTTRPVKRVSRTKATAVCVLLDFRVRNVKMVRGSGDVMETGSLSKTRGNGNENLDKQNV